MLKVTGWALEGTAEHGPACTFCHSQSWNPNAGEALTSAKMSHHGGNRSSPYTECVACHGDPATGELTGNHFGSLLAHSCYRCHGEVWIDPILDEKTPAFASPTATATGIAGEQMTITAGSITGDEDNDPLSYQFSFGDRSAPEFPSRASSATHTYVDVGEYDAAVWVTDGKHTPSQQLITITITSNPAATADNWTLYVTETGENILVLLENRSGALVVTVTRDSAGSPETKLAYGVEFDGVIFWMELWMDMSSSTFWGTGDMFFGTVNRTLGTMRGVIFRTDGSVQNFTESP